MNKNFFLTFEKKIFVEASSSDSNVTRWIDCSLQVL